MPVNRRLPPLRALEAFVRTVRLGSAKAAAAELGLSPSALSRRVQALEDFLGKRLFARQHQSMKLTDEGQTFYNAIAEKLDELAQAVEGQMDGAHVMRLHLGVLPLFGSQRLFPRLPELRRLHPRLHIDIDTGPHLDERLAPLFDVEVDSPYSYWFICRERDLENRPLRIFHDWLVKAGL